MGYGNHPVHLGHPVLWPFSISLTISCNAFSRFHLGRKPSTIFNHGLRGLHRWGRNGLAQRSQRSQRTDGGTTEDPILTTMKKEGRVLLSVSSVSSVVNFGMPHLS